MHRYKRVIAIGDIHGQFEKLTDLWEKIGFDEDNDLLVFLGDYIDRGPRSLDCLRFIKLLTSHKKNIIALRGNHEDFLLKYFDTNSIKRRNDDDIWLDPNNGGRKTLDQLEKLPPKEVCEIISFIASLPYYYDGIPNWFFVHAGINPHYGLYEQRYEDYLWVRGEFISHYDGETNFVVGHTPVQYLNRSISKPILLGNHIIMMDTGAAMGKVISALDLKTHTLWQSF